MSENFIKLKSSAVKLICVVFIAFLVEVYGEYFKEIYNTFGKIFYMLGGTYLTANLMSTPIQEFQKALNPYLPRIFRSNQRFEDCLYKYNRMKSFITNPTTINKIEQYIREAEVYLCNTTGSSDTIAFEALIKKIDFILTLHEPIPMTKIDINSVIAKFDDVIVDNKEELIAKILVPFILRLNGESNIPLNPVYLLGSPGVGKTHFVNKMSEIIGIPIVNTTLVNYNYHQNVHTDSRFDEQMIHMYIRTLYTAITTKKTRTFIMFIDEFDKKIERTSNVLEYMNCNNNEVFDYYLDIGCDIGNILPVCAGNKRISKVHKCHAPLDDRFVTINFPRMTQEIKSGIVYDILNIPRSGGIDTLINNDRFHGIRQLLMKVNIYRSSIMGSEFFKGTSWEKIIKKQLFEQDGEGEEEDSEIDEPIKKTKTRTRARARSKSPLKKN
jgi:hypothetical protein